ncbi:ankyrin repeat domain-containing protein [Vibrio sp. TH_r3]|uniref:ankyrin repeat domain-containing protein n=1 Tax=Vibrio sp. TH_r3 TaxID=3082084 RepID=UPI0029549FBF|nr:ankyrin repeat domain-containing protein [Vibrio sp. TH_r3]MDV7104871.1 ankyrin repeat domain-containing protein [Vibrio sp. TH_r3]
MPQKKDQSHSMTIRLFKLFFLIVFLLFLAIGYFIHQNITLIESAKQGNLLQTEIALSSGVDVNSVPFFSAIFWGDGKTALMWAANKGHIDIVKLLIEHGADVNSKNRWNGTALSQAAMNGHLNIVKLLIEHDSHITSDALLLASRNGHTDIGKLLIEQGADINAKDTAIIRGYNRGQNALTMAIDNGHVAIAKLLIEKGIDVHKKDQYQNTALSMASDKNEAELVKMLVEHGAGYLTRFSFSDSDAKLIRSARKGDLAGIMIALSAGADINSESSAGQTALIEAFEGVFGQITEQKYLAVIKALIENGADIHARDNYGYTVLERASSNGRLEVVKLLINTGAEVYINGALVAASLSGHIDVVDFLIKQSGADINIQDSRGNTALSQAAWKGHVDIVELLIEKGADVNIKNSQRYTALMTSIEEDQPLVAIRLIEHGATMNEKYRLGKNDGRTILMEAIHKGYFDVVELLITQGVDLNGKDNNGTTALLMDAIYEGRTHTPSLYKLGYSSTLLAQYEQLFPGIEKAVHQRQRDQSIDFQALPGLARALIEHGANKQLKDQDGNTALIKACANGHLELAQFLIDNGVDINAKNKEGNTALTIAEAADHASEMVNILAKAGAKR